jgi:hypothetical protein
MNILRQEYDGINGFLYVEFSINEDEDIFYRTVELDYNDVILYSPNIITKNDIEFLEESDVVEILIEFFKDNDLPGQIYL